MPLKEEHMQSAQPVKCLIMTGISKALNAMARQRMMVAMSVRQRQQQ